ncbi:MAG: peptide chain release factor 2 [Dehalococcoidia bacterium]
MEELRSRLEQLQGRIAQILSVFEVPRKEQAIAELEREAAAAHFWDDPQEAQRRMQQLARLKETVEFWRNLERRTCSLLELVQMALQAGESSLSEQLTTEVDALTAEFRQQEFLLVFSGEYDAKDAILSIHAGAGGTESQDWAQMLLRMYLRWAEKKGHTTQLLDLSPGEEAGIKSATVEVRGRLVYGWLKAEKGVHRLVRLSPFDAAHLRHTSFVLVEVMPAAEENVDVTINPDDLQTDFFRASGPGGQHVQKVASAVRITHLPTGTVVSCQNERSQHQNREFAMKILRARLLELELQRQAQEQARLKGEHISPEWGNQIRSYVLHPYKLVKDHRTGYQASDPEAILDGDLDEALRAYLLHTVGEAAP